MPLKPIRISVTVPAELEPLIAARIGEEHYHSKSAFMLGLLLFDLGSRCKHWLTSDLLSGPQEMLDKAVVELLREFPNLPRRDGGWFRGMVKAIMDEHHGNPLGDKIVKNEGG